MRHLFPTRVRNPLRKRWHAVLIGHQDDGQAEATPFRFWSKSIAERWVAQMNRDADEDPFDDLVRFEVRKRD